jgi:hypothetical protein
MINRPGGTGGQPRRPHANVPIELGSHRLRLRFPDGRLLERSVDVSEHSRYFSFP